MSDSVRPHRRQPTRLPCPWDSPGKNTGVGCHVLLQCMKMKSESEVAHLCLTFSDPMDCSLPGSSVHGIFQARVLEWGAIAFSEMRERGSQGPEEILHSHLLEQNHRAEWEGTMVLCIKCPPGGSSTLAQFERLCTQRVSNLGTVSLLCSFLLLIIFCLVTLLTGPNPQGFIILEAW